ncbi:MAG: FHA domain-containing protein [Pseudomonadota bacterium]|nr:FHA domain-containing protein [Pseudomonadota bacterium]
MSTAVPPLYLELVPEPGDALHLAHPRVPLSERPLQIGRGPENALVLSEDTVSWHHATVWLDRGIIRVQDRASTNGTWIDDTRLDGEGPVRPGQVLRLGRRVRLRVVSIMPTMPDLGPSWRLEVLESGASVAIPPDSLRVGSGPGVSLSLPLDGVAWFAVHPRADGAEIETDEGQHRGVKAGVAFTIGQRSFRILAADGPTVPTVGERSPTDGFRLEVSLDGPAGPEAVLHDPLRGVEHRVTAENRAVLLYVLAVKVLEDRAAKVPDARQGWLADEELASGVWGREALRMDANNLNVLIHRLRKELAAAGFDPSFLERRNHAARLSLVHVTRR